jgi:hypothetical protein
MTCLIGDIEFGGNRGHILPPRPQMDYYTRFGDDKVYMQKVNTSSQVSNITCWKFLDSQADAKSLIDQIREYVVGKRINITLSSGYEYPSAYIVDFSFTLRAGGGSGAWLIEVEFQIVADEKKD